MLKSSSNEPNSDYLDYIDNLDQLDQPDQLNHSESLKHSIWRKKQNSHFLLGLVLLRIFFSSISYFILLHPESSSIVWEGLRWLQHKNHLLDHILFLETFCCCWRAKLSSLFETNQKRRKSSAQSASSGGGQYRTGIKHKITKSTAGRVEGLNSSEHTTVNIWHLLPLSDWQIPKGAKQPAVVKLSIFSLQFFAKVLFWLEQSHSTCRVVGSLASVIHWSKVRKPTTKRERKL